MALFLPTDTFAYIDADEKIKHVDGTDVIDRGVWSGSIAYVANDVVSFNNMLFVALTANFNMSPTAIVDDNWSSLVKTSAGGESSDLTLDDVYDLAIQAGSLAYEALQAAWAGTEAASSVAYPALVTAWVGTATANVALQVASTGTDLAYDALVTAWVGTATANSALETASTGTLAAAAGIDLANHALVLAQIGTEVPFLDDLQDVNAPSPTVAQVLAWSGAEWVASDPPATSSAAGFTLFLDNTPSGISTYERLAPVPTGAPEDSDSAFVASANGASLINSYISDPVNRTLIDSGLWMFNTFASTDSQPGTIATDIYVRDIAGNETYLFSGTSTAISSVTPPQLSSSIVAASSYVVARTDRIIARYWGITDQPTPITLSIYQNGEDHYSHISTPLRTSHNDLAGLQGGTTDEYYHSTEDQNAALVGTQGDPSLSNPFVTDADPRLDLAQSAYDLASTNPAQPDVGNWLLSGGNVVWVSGYNFQVPYTSVAFNGTAVNFPAKSLTLTPASATDDRIDIIVADATYGTIGAITGIASTPPALPDYDPVFQFQLSFVPVSANTTQPVTATRTWIYQENVEWTFSGSPTVNANSLVSPHAGSKAVEGTNCADGHFFAFAAPLVFDLSAFDMLYFYLKPKTPAWGAKYLRLNWEAANGQRKGNYVSIGNGAYGFDSSNLSYQVIAVPLSLFAVPTQTSIQNLRFTIMGAGGFGFYIDDIAIQVGVAAVASPPIQDATTSVKGIVQLEASGGTVPGRAVTGDDSRLALISSMSSVLGISFQGTFALYMANFRNGPSDNKVTVINGVVVAQTPSYYIWEDFENYPSGTLPPLTLGSAWSGAGTIVTQPGIGIQAEDQVQYGTGTYLEPFTGTVYRVMSGGTGWAGTATLSIPYVGLKGTETFSNYNTGTYPAGTGPFIYGIGWAGAGTVIPR